MQILGIFTSCKPILAISNNEVNFSEDKTLTLWGGKENSKKWIIFFWCFFVVAFSLFFFIFLRDNICIHLQTLLIHSREKGGFYAVKPFILFDCLVQDAHRFFFFIGAQKMYPVVQENLQEKKRSVPLASSHVEGREFSPSHHLL